MNGIWGERDAPANPRAPQRVAALRELRPDADVRMIPGAGHWVAYEAPEQFNADAAGDAAHAAISRPM